MHANTRVNTHAFTHALLAQANSLCNWLLIQLLSLYYYYINNDTTRTATTTTTSTATTKLSISVRRTVSSTTAK